MITIIAVVVVFHTTQDWRLLPTAISSRWCDGMDDNNIIDFQISARHKTNHDAPIIELYLPTLSVLMCYDGSDVDMKMMDAGMSLAVMNDKESINVIVIEEEKVKEKIVRQRLLYKKK